MAPLATNLNLTEAALALLQLHLDGLGYERVTDATREAYRELARAGFMEPLSSFTWGKESHFRLTAAGVSYARADHHASRPRSLASGH